MKLSAPVRAIALALGAKVLIAEVTPESPFAEDRLEFPDGSQLIVRELDFSLNRHEPRMWPSLVATMLITARALAGNEVDAQHNRALTPRLYEALEQFMIA